MRCRGLEYSRDAGEDGKCALRLGLGLDERLAIRGGGSETGVVK